jgi:hypothetical protein
VGVFVDYHGKHLIPEILSYLQDTTDLLRHFEELNTSNLHQGAFSVFIDVVGLYSNIPLKEGIDYFEKAPNKRKDRTVPTSLVITILSLVLTLNIFKFGTLLFQQLIERAMRTKVAPTFANILMAMIDKKLLHNGDKYVYFFKGLLMIS